MIYNNWLIDQFLIDMLHTDHHHDLTHLNTMALTCTAKEVITLTDEKQLEQLPTDQKYFILSGGSNVLLPKYLDTTVLLPRFLGIKIREETEQSILLEVMAGENWHNLVISCTQKGWYGLENLALIPGLVGAAPVQNIGAYGVSLEDVLVGVKIFHLDTGEFDYIDKLHCHFSYRDSVFKHSENILIVSIQLKLHKNPNQYNKSYGDVAKIAQQFADAENNAITPLHIMQAVIAIRQSKLPDPAVLANCGSFFQNPIIPMADFERLKAQFPNLPSYPIDDTTIKIPAGWLIDHAGLKGKGIFPILTHEKQALVLTNHAPQIATQDDIKRTQDFIIDTIWQQFGVRLVREPVWVDG